MSYSTQKRFNKKFKKIKKNETKKIGKLKVMLLGGIDEIGKNITAIEYENDIIVIDCGLGFPDEDMYGIDLVIPDTQYLESNIDRVRGIFLTHGHEDHIGALPYVLKTLPVPVYGTKLTLGILSGKLKEHSYEKEPRLVCVEAGDVINAGEMSVEFIHVNHSIADACCLAVKTPRGTVIHSGDFKIDLSPVDGEITDIARLGQLGKEGVLLLMCESTNAERPGFTPSEKLVGKSLDNIFMLNKDKRIVIATFSSNVHRVQQIINTSVQFGRKVAVTGRSMQSILKAAIDLGYMDVPDGVLIDISEIKRHNPEKLTIITTGSQGEPMSALYRMAYGDHDKIILGSHDLVVISAHAIPGNEKLVDKIINELFKNGVSVFRDVGTEVHVSGHAAQEELKLMHALVKPKYFMPIHGEHKHLITHKELAKTMGMNEDRIFIADLGRILEFDDKGAKFNGIAPAGKLLIDGYGVGDVGNIVLRDRKHLSEDGIIIVVSVVSADDCSLLSGPDIVSRGFVYVRESEELMTEVKKLADEAVNKCINRNIDDWNEIKSHIKNSLSKYIYNKTGRKPMILPVIMEV